MIALSDVHRLYRSDEVETTALRSIDLASGCGKSTLLNILGTIDRPSSGRYQFDSTDLTKLPEADLAAFRRDHLGYIFQSFNLIDDLTIEENVELGLVYRKVRRAERRSRVAAAMDRVGIGHRARHTPNQLSGGQQQRAAIARAIVGEPLLILADEPTGNLDTENGAQVMDILSALNAEGATIVMVTHSPSHADIARRRIDMLDGRVVISVRNAM
jgi:putative ABC transport system ATP-binding protein